MKFRYPCGHCYECLSKKRSDWSIRMQEEFKSKGAAYHAILTYRDEDLPRSKSGISQVSKKDCQDFLKRFRYYFGKKFTYFLAAEYGEFTQRPHYHIIIFASKSDLFVTDLHFCRENVPNESMRLMLEKAWKHGFVRRQSKMVVSAAQLHYVTKDLYHFTSPMELHEAFMILKNDKNNKLLDNFVRNTYEAFLQNGYVDDRAATFRLFSKGLGVEFVDSSVHLPDSLHRKYNGSFLPRKQNGVITRCPNGYVSVGDFHVRQDVYDNFRFDDSGEFLYPPDLSKYLKDYEVIQLVREDGKSKIKASTYALPRYYRERLYPYDIRAFISLKYYFRMINKAHEYALDHARYDATHDTPYYLLQAENKFQQFYKSHKDKYNSKLINNELDGF